MDAGAAPLADAPAAEALTLVEAALQVLNEPDPLRKAALGELFAVQWLRGDIAEPFPLHRDPPPPPRRPARPPAARLLPSSRMPRLGKGGSLQSRQAIVHSLVHTESWAVDLSWDIIARFGKREAMPREFFADFVAVARDEGRHFTLLRSRLEELGSSYGAFPVHDGLWDSAARTSEDLMARLAIEHCVHEARGLDVLPTTISRLRSGGDDRTADLLQNVVYPEEITHCSAGVRWFRYLCKRSTVRYMDPSVTPLTPLLNPKTEKDLSENDDDDAHGNNQELVMVQNLEGDAESGTLEDAVVIEKFHAIVRRYFKGILKPPFNKQAREQAGFNPAWYEPLAEK